jgi:hypothetical protein
MDEILQEFVLIKNDEAKIMLMKLVEENGVSNETNKLRFKLGDEFMLLLYDMFMFDDGPRIRDRLSHGEYKINYDMNSNNVYKLYASLCIRIISYLANNDSSKVKNNIFSDYKCNYHPLAIIKFDLINLTSFLISKCLNKTLNIEQIILKFIVSSNLLPVDNIKLNELKSLSNLIDYLNEESINSKYLYLYSKTNNNNALQIITIIKQLINECLSFLETIYNYIETTKIKQDNKQLRERQRETFKYFQENSLTIKFETSIKDVILILTCIYSMLINSNKSDGHVKILRKYLTIFQNLSQQSKINRWLECVQLIDELYKIFAISNSN